MESRGTVVLGSSHAYAIVPEHMGLSGVNLAHDGQDLFEVAYIARTVKARAPKLDTVIIALSYFSFVFDNAAYTLRGVETRIGQRIDLYAAFGRLSFIPGDGSEYLKGMLWPLVTRDHFEAGFAALGPKVAHAEELEDDTVADRDRHGAADVEAPRGKRPSKTLAFYQKHAERRCRQYDALIRTMRSRHPGLERDAYDVLRDVVAELEQSEIDVVLVTPPYFEPYNECFAKRWQELTRKNGQRIAEATGARYFDFSHHPEFREMNRFMDSDHIRANHWKRLSRALASEMEESP
jgi:hypothetical protein